MRKINYSIVGQVLAFVLVLTVVLNTVGRYLALFVVRSSFNEKFLSIVSPYLYAMPLLTWPGRILFLAVALVMYYVVLRLERDSSYPALLTKQTIIKPLIKGFLVMAGIQTSSFLLSLLTGCSIIVGFTSHTPLVLLGVFALDILIKSFNDLAEELVFRGYAITRLTRALGPVPAIWLSGILFMAIHMVGPTPWLSFTCLHWLLFGVFWGYMYALTRSIYFTMGMHLGGNVFMNQLQQIWLHVENTTQYEVIVTVAILIGIGVGHYLLVQRESLQRST